MGKWFCHPVGQATENADVERQVGHLELRWERFRLDDSGIVLVAPEHDPAIGVAHVDGRLEETDRSAGAAALPRSAR